MKDVTTWHDVSPEQFHTEIRPTGQPAILKGLVKDWPIVSVAQQGDAPLLAYLRSKAVSSPISSIQAPPECEGRLHYCDDVRRLNFERVAISLADFLDRLLAEAARERPAALAAQGLLVPKCLPGFAALHPLRILPPAVIPRMWIGNAATVAAHSDDLENVACVVAGRRRFTLFPPEQVGNLYMGPFELTPAGAPISMVDASRPDHARYPRFAEALSAAQCAELEPGDALYIPYQWYHQVESLAPVNILVNYWWDAARPDLGSPWDVLLHAVASLRGLPPEQRRAWRAMFDQYVFLENGDPGGHLPEHARGILARDTPDDIKQLMQDLVTNLTSQSSAKVGPFK